jgi:hypothetical protein
MSPASADRRHHPNYKERLDYRHCNERWSYRGSRPFKDLNSWELQHFTPETTAKTIENG